MLDDLEVLYTDTGGIELAYGAVGEGLTVGADLAFEHRAREELRGIPGTWDLYVLCP